MSIPTSGVVSCLVAVGLLACSRPQQGAPPVAPEVEAREGSGGEGSMVLRPKTQAEVVTAEIERVRQLHALALAEGDAALQVRARFELAEVYARGVSELDVVRFDIDEERLAGPPGPRPDLEQRQAEIVAEQQAWLDAAAVEYAEVLAATGPAALGLRAQARYGLAEVERRRGNAAAAHDALVALVHDDPAHPLAALALVTLADEAFEAVRLDEAKALYEQVLALGGRERHYARYKLGWIALNQDDAPAALAHFTAVVREARDDVAAERLADVAAKDCVIAYARAGRPERARAFFTHLDPAHADELLRRLARIYEDEGRPEDAARALGLSRK